MSPDFQMHDDLNTSWPLGILPPVRHAMESQEVTKSAWASPAPWVEVVARSRGRAKYNSIRKLRARVRRLAIIRRLRYVDDIHQRGLQRQLAEELGIVASVICEDFKQILAARHADGKPRGTRASRRPPRAQEETMSQRCTVRLPATPSGINAFFRTASISSSWRRWAFWASAPSCFSWEKLSAG